MASYETSTVDSLSSGRFRPRADIDCCRANIAWDAGERFQLDFDLQFVIKGGHDSQLFGKCFSSAFFAVIRTG